MISHKHTHKYRITTFMFKTPKFFWPLTAPLDIKKICVLKIFEEICVAVTTTAYNLSVFGVFWSLFPHIRTEYWDTRSISPCPVQMRENTNRKNSEYGHFSGSAHYKTVARKTSKTLFLFQNRSLLQAKAQVWINFFINFENSDAWQSKYLFLYPRRRQEDVLRNI